MRYVKGLLPRRVNYVLALDKVPALSEHMDCIFIVFIRLKVLGIPENLDSVNLVQVPSQLYDKGLTVDCAGGGRPNELVPVAPHHRVYFPCLNCTNHVQFNFVLLTLLVELLHRFNFRLAL